ncbi:MAG: AmmeMemoRadiSam system protein B [Desulfurococcus sp.]|nr:AmmeMemoRadiSam system protein B [Desulfurococcus sp.]
MKRRIAVVAGYFYPEDPGELREMIEWSFKHPVGPGSLPLKTVETPLHGILGYVVPHAGYVYSGPVAAHAFHDMALNGKPDVVVILGTNHTGLGKPVSVYPEGVWETPLGALTVDGELSKKIVEYSDVADFDEYAHLEEHSVEVQLPFLAYLYGSAVRIVPIVIGVHTPDVAFDLARAIRRAVESLGKNTIILASSDFNHYEPHEETVRKDLMAIDEILRLDIHGFYNVMMREGISICGPGGIMTLMEYTRMLGGRVSLLKHATSGDTSGDKTHVVGYASIKFYL